MAEELADFTGPNEQEAAPAAADSDSDDSDGLPPLDGYWSSVLNVSKVADPLSTSKLLQLAREGQDEMRSKGGRDKGKGKGLGFGLGKGKKGGRKGRNRDVSDITDFFAWISDPATEDGSRPQPEAKEGGRDRSRSPRREDGKGVKGGKEFFFKGKGKGKFKADNRTDGERLEDFLSWAKDMSEVKKEKNNDGEEDEDPDLNNFMAWAVTDDAEPEEDPPQDLFPPQPFPRRVEERLPDPEDFYGPPVASLDQTVAMVLPGLLKAVPEEAAEGPPAAPARHRFEEERDEDDDA
eukprot:TRINITY_DN123000_c0_g1_i1.p1 TRINITY_DN123000_c0_g1~~TRINITY_DN123000_c0_g1_i1.p1  ORF type:complete len:293 (+),score=92.06 TRINITY_DN123000_c0_g1_i1:92-970(+)